MSGFAAPLGLRHRHLQSVLGAWSIRGRLVRSRATHFVKSAAAKTIDCGNGIKLLGLSNEHDIPSRGVAIVLHGWEGCADSNYMVTVGDSLFAAGLDVLRLNFRDHGRTQHLNQGLFHSCRIDEVVGAIAAVRATAPQQPLYLVGFSLGGNFALRVAAHRCAEQLGIRKVVAICPVLRPHSTMRALEDGLWIYRQYFLSRWRRSLLAKSALFPNVYHFGDLRRFPTLTETTAFFVENYTHFESLDEYLTGYSITGSALRELAADCILIATSDDPVIPIADLQDVATSDRLDVRILQHGGHCGLIDSYRLSSWADQAVVDMLGPSNGSREGIDRKISVSCWRS